MRLCLILALLLCAGPVTGGPWLRAPAQGFLSFGANIALSEAAERPVHYDPTLFFEYGISERLTLGLEAYRANAGEEEAVAVFATLPLWPGDAAPTAVSLGLGHRRERTRDSPEALLRLGLSGGRGLGSGWLTTSALLQRGTERALTEAKLDLTWGHDITDRATLVLQLQTGRGTGGDIYAKAAPALVWTATERLRLEAGVVQALTGDVGTGLRLGTWWRF